MDAALAMLGNEGHQVARSDNLYRALACGSANQPNVLLVDLDDFDPKEFAFFDVFREQVPEAQILLTVSPIHRSKAVAAMVKGAVAYLLKPFYIDELCALVRNTMVRRLGATLDPEAPATAPEAGAAERAEAVMDFAKGVAHEINNPLTTISGWVQMLLSETPASDPKRKTLALMDEEARRIADVVGNLQAFAEQRPADRRLVPAAKLINDVVDDFEAVHRGDGIKFERSIDESLPTINVDIEHIREAFKSILDHIAAPEHANGAMRVSTSLNGADTVLAHFHNPSYVIGDQQLDRVLEPFHITEGRGLGLGLAIAYGVVRNHGGWLTVSSEAETGTEFTVALPTDGGAAAPKGSPDGGVE